MRRHLSALCVIALLFASVGAAAPLAAETAGLRTSSSAATPVTQVPDTTSYLALDGPGERSEVATAGLDVGGALAADSAALRGHYEDLRSEKRFRTAPNESARRAVLQTAADRIERRVDGLERRERTARAEYNDGRITTERYLRRLAVIDAEASRLSARISQLSTRVDAVEGKPVSDRRLAGLKADLVPLEGPVRALTVRAMAGKSAPLRSYVETSGDGLVLATVHDPGVTSMQEYVREAYVASARNDSRPNRFANGTQAPLDAAEERARALYPWAFENHQGYAIGPYAGGLSLQQAGVYPVAVNHPHGVDRRSDIVIYLDGGTTDVFREVQYKGLAHVPTTELGQNRTDRLVLGVNATRPGGPARVTVTDTVGTPVAATVYVDGERLGGTGEDGQRWFVAPGGQTNVTVVHDDARATVVGGA